MQGVPALMPVQNAVARLSIMADEENGNHQRVTELAPRPRARLQSPIIQQQQEQVTPIAVDVTDAQTRSVRRVPLGELKVIMHETIIDENKNEVISDKRLIQLEEIQGQKVPADFIVEEMVPTPVVEKTVVQAPVVAAPVVTAPVVTAPVVPSPDAPAPVVRALISRANFRSSLTSSAAAQTPAEPAPVVQAQPAIVPLPQPQTKTVPVNLLPKHQIIASGTLVCIVHILKYDNLYVVDHSKLTEYQRLLHDVAAFGESARPLTSIVSDMYAAAPLEDGTFARAMILRVPAKNEPVLVAFVDHGYAQTVDASVLRQLSDELILRDRLPRKIQLADVPEQLDGETFLTFLKSLQDDQVELKLMYSGAYDLKTKCSLSDAASSKSLHEVFANFETGMQMLNQVVETESGIKVSVLPRQQHHTHNLIIQFDAGIQELNIKNIEGVDRSVIITDKGSLKFGVLSACLISDLELFTKNQQKISEYCKDVAIIPHVPKWAKDI